MVDRMNDAMGDDVPAIICLVRDSVQVTLSAVSMSDDAHIQDAVDDNSMMMPTSHIDLSTCRASMSSARVHTNSGRTMRYKRFSMRQLQMLALNDVVDYYNKVIDCANVYVVLKRLDMLNYKLIAVVAVP